MLSVSCVIRSRVRVYASATSLLADVSDVTRRNVQTMAVPAINQSLSTRFAVFLYLHRDCEWLRPHV